MKLYPNLKPALLIFSLIFLYSLQASAQFPGMNKVYSNMAKQNARQQMDMMNSMNMNRMWNWRQGAGKGATYHVTFKDSSLKEVTSYMYTDTLSHKSFLVFVDKKFPKSDSAHRFQKIYTDQTLYISTITDYQANTETYGIPNDSCWMFKVISGPLNVYAKSFNYLIPVDDFGNENELDPQSVIAIQSGDGPIVKYTSDNLKQIVSQDTEALSSVEKKKYYKAVKKYNRHAEKAEKK